MIDDLVKDLRPVRPVWPIGVRMAAWVGVAVAAAMGLLMAVSVRRDLDLVLRSGRLLIDAGTVMLMALTAAWGALRLSIPGEEKAWAHKYLPFGILGFWLVFSIVQIAFDAIQAGARALIPDPHLACALLVAGAGTLLTLPIGLLIRGAAPLEPRWCGALAGMAASSAALVGVELICVFERPAHFGFYHVIPVTLFTALGAWLGPKLLPTLLEK